MIEQGAMLLERDVSEVSAPAWLRYWQRLGWEVEGEPEVVGPDGTGHRVLDFHLRAAHPGAVLPVVHAARDHHALAA